MDAPKSVSPGQAVMDIQVLRRRARARDWDVWSPELRQPVLDAEARLTAVTGLELVTLLLAYCRDTGTRIKL